MNLEHFGLIGLDLHHVFMCSLLLMPHSCEVLVGAIFKHHNNPDASPPAVILRNARSCFRDFLSLFVSGFLLLMCVWVLTAPGHDLEMATLACAAWLTGLS